VLACCTGSEFAVSRVQVEWDPAQEVGAARGLGQDISSPEEAVGGDWTPPPKGIVTLRVEVRGAKSVARLAERLSEILSVTSVQVGDGNSPPIESPSVDEFARCDRRSFCKLRHDRLHLRLPDKRNRLLRIDPLNDALPAFGPRSALPLDQQREDLDLAVGFSAVLISVFLYLKLPIGLGRAVGRSQRKSSGFVCGHEAGAFRCEWPPSIGRLMTTKPEAFSCAPCQSGCRG
jgi:hypothetical protein